MLRFRIAAFPCIYESIVLVPSVVCWLPVLLWLLVVFFVCFWADLDDFWCVGAAAVLDGFWGHFRCVLGSFVTATKVIFR